MSARKTLINTIGSSNKIFNKKNSLILGKEFSLLGKKNGIGSTKINSFNICNYSTLCNNLNNQQQSVNVSTQTIDLREKSPKESFHSFKLKFSTDKNLRNIYSTAFNTLRIGRLLQDLDNLAWQVAYKHADGNNPKHPLTIVTAAVDRIELRQPLVPYFDLIFEAKATYVGTSSMEIKIEVVVEKPDVLVKDLEEGDHIFDPNRKIIIKRETAMVAYFVLVALDKVTNLPAKVHPLKLESEEDKRNFEIGRANQSRRKYLRDNSLEKQPPNEKERDLIHNWFLKLQSENANEMKDHSSDDSNISSMKSTKLTNFKIMHPTNRNINSKIFGGYLMQESFELAWLTAYKYTQYRPTFIALDDNNFLKPVEKGSVVKFESTVVYTEHNLLMVRVEVKVIEPPLEQELLCNVFHFSFACPTKKLILPETYVDAIYFLEGKRISEKGIEMTQALQGYLAQSKN
ncbi:hypothetical protein ABK040_008146 [Willaertia magna]